MDTHLRLHPENLSLFVEPLFKREAVGYYSVSAQKKYQADYSEKASLVALKESDKTSQGIAEYEVPAHIEELNLTEGYETYNDDYDEARPSDLLTWLRSHPDSCNNVDIVCPQRTLSKIYRAPYTEATSTPWEIKVTRGPDGVCYLSEGDGGRIKYNEMNVFTKQQYFRQQAFQRYMTIKKGSRSKDTPPSDHSSGFYRVNKLDLDSGVIIYPSEIQCFDINYNAIELKVRLEGQFDLPSPAVRLGWWSDAHLSGINTLLCGYYTDDDDEDEDDDDSDVDDTATIRRLTSFDIKHIKPRRIRDTNFDDEVCIGSLCTFVQFVKDVTLDEKVSSFILRFEPGSKRMCILELKASQPKEVPSFGTQISATDETSSVEATPRTPRGDDGQTTPRLDASAQSMPRLRKYNRQDSQANGPTQRRRNTVTAESGGSDPAPEVLDNDNDKYRRKIGSKRRKQKQELEDNWVHISIILVFIAFSFIGIPMAIEYLGLPSPY